MTCGRSRKTLLAVAGSGAPAAARGPETRHSARLIPLGIERISPARDNSRPVVLQRAAQVSSFGRDAMKAHALLAVATGLLMAAEPQKKTTEGPVEKKTVRYTVEWFW